MTTLGRIVRRIKESPILNDLYRQYTEYKVGRSYKNRNATDIFTQISLENSWVGKESVSGIGSDFVQTQYIIKSIPLVLHQLQIRTLLDLPCGDHQWMKEVELSGVSYIGCDIVASLIEGNNKMYGNATKKFMVVDLIEDSLPQADLVLVRDCFVHLSYDNIDSALSNLKKSNIKYLLTTTFPDSRRNYDITTGNWRPLNLLKPPFNFPKPNEVIVENCTESYGQYSDKSLGLWEIKNLPSTIR